MKQKVLFLILFFLTIARPLEAFDSPLGCIKLLPGYNIKNEGGIDVSSWTIAKPGKLVIHFEAGPSEGALVNEKDKSTYRWYRKQIVNGHIALFALVEPNSKVSQYSNSKRQLGSRLIVTFPLGGFGGKDHVANFVAEITNSTDLADALLIIMSFDPSKGNF